MHQKDHLVKNSQSQSNHFSTYLASTRRYCDGSTYPSKTNTKDVDTLEHNLNPADRYMRLVTGLISMGCATAHSRQSSIVRAFLLSFGAMKVAEGILDWCPLQHLATQSNRSSHSATQQANQHSHQSSERSSQRSDKQSGENADQPQEHSRSQED